MHPYHQCLHGDFFIQLVHLQWAETLKKPEFYFLIKIIFSVGIANCQKKGGKGMFKNTFQCMWPGVSGFGHCEIEMDSSHFVCCIIYCFFYRHHHQVAWLHISKGWWCFQGFFKLVERTKESISRNHYFKMFIILFSLVLFMFSLMFNLFNISMFEITSFRFFNLTSNLLLYFRSKAAEKQN